MFGMNELQTCILSENLLTILSRLHAVYERDGGSIKTSFGKA